MSNWPKYYGSRKPKWKLISNEKNYNTNEVDNIEVNVAKNIFVRINSSVMKSNF